ncbi:MAG: 30S ribosomal protein S20 [Candidatus Omnitrophica bacterium]|jgi:small subunit ribosomal protein S20|nr:30S ribosomal protein S20 [Candidatus Omnitrophota bacterium]
MANRRNSIKKIKADAVKRDHNRTVLSELRTIERKFREACASKEADKAKTLNSTLFSKLDKALKRGTLKENVVSRTKSRLTLSLNKVAKA